jgi:hypothetical protein
VRRREFLGSLLEAAMVHTDFPATAPASSGAAIPPVLPSIAPPFSASPDNQNELKSTAIGVMIRPAHDNREAAGSRQHSLWRVRANASDVLKVREQKA